jgi:hypothetical protein
MKPCARFASWCFGNDPGTGSVSHNLQPLSLFLLFLPFRLQVGYAVNLEQFVHPAIGGTAWIRTYNRMVRWAIPIWLRSTPYVFHIWCIN